MDNKWFPRFTIEEGRNTHHGVNGILNHYHRLCDPYIDIGRFYIIRIPYDCIEFMNIMGLPWDTYIVPKDQT